MSDKKPETPEAKDGAAEGADAAQNAPKGPPVVLIAVIAAALVAGAALGAMLLAPPLIAGRQKAELAARIAAAEAGPDAKKKKDKGKKGDKGGAHGAEGGKSPIYRIDNVIVNPAGSYGQRFLMCSVAVQLEDDAVVEALRSHEVEVRDAVISTLEGNTLEQLTQPGARDTLRARLASAIQPLLGHDAEDAHLRVFLPQFVIQ